MSRPVPQPDYSNAGPVRDAAFLASRAIPARALTADLATNASNTAKVSTDAPKVALEDTDLIALVTVNGTIQPVTIANLLAFLETRYVLTPTP